MKRNNQILIPPAGLLFLSLMLVIPGCQKKGTSYSLDTSIIKKGSIINTITATGTLQATTTVQVGTQVSGVIQKLFVDFNSVVKKGQILAEIDKTPLLTAVHQAEASLDDSRSEVEFQKATFDRFKVLLDKKLVAQADFDQVKYNYEKAKSNLKNAQSQYDKAMVNLNYASIYSPIDGVVMNRAVDQGQTVAASFNTPTLFSIANDLTRMQVEANIDEADIGQVIKGLDVEFTVDAYPDNVFKGLVKEVRLQPIVTSNVVTYTVIINAPNPDKKLMPGMTANITVFVQRLDSVLVVPGKALRFTPDQAFLAEYGKQTTEGKRGQAPGTSQNGANGRPGAGANQNGNGFQQQIGNSSIKKPTVVWVRSNGTIHRTRIQTGISDGTGTQVISGLKEGDEVILSINSPNSKTAEPAAEARSPFVPQRNRGASR